MKIPVTVTTLNAETGETIKKTATHATLVVTPVPAGTCEECGRQHEATSPHDALSLRYQYRFYSRHNRFPTWTDALAHCPPHIRDAWLNELAARGIFPVPDKGGEHGR